MNALTLHAPWAWAVVHGYKPVENRSWSTKHRGPLAIHASKSRAADAEACRLFAALGIEPPADFDPLRGCVLGVVQIVGVIEETAPGRQSSWVEQEYRKRCGNWWRGPVGWELAGPRALARPVRCVGRQAIWTLPPDVAREVLAQLDG